MRDRTRRELIRGTVVGVAGVLGADAASAPGVAAAASAGVLGGARGDPALVRRLTEIEQLVEFAYAHVVASGVVSGAAGALVREFLGHERIHVGLLSSQVAALGFTAPAPPSDLDAASHELASLGVPGGLRLIGDRSSALHYLIGVETLAEGAYYQAMAKLSGSALRVLAARTMGCEAQHWSALSGLLHAGDVYRAVPYPVVLG